MEQGPELLGSGTRKGMLDSDGSAQTFHILLRIGARNACPAVIRVSVGPNHVRFSNVEEVMLP
jgi:hypothetical protein